MMALLITIIPQVKADIGYNFNSSNNETHIWNDGNIKQDYYYTGYCNNQISNVPNEQWEIVTLGLTYGNTIESRLTNVYPYDEYDCTRTEYNDSNSVNITTNKFKNNVANWGKESYIELEDDYMKETFYFIPERQLSSNFWFVIMRDNINVGGTLTDNFIQVYFTNGTSLHYNLTYINENNLTIYLEDVESYFFLTDIVQDEHIVFTAIGEYESNIVIDKDTIYTMFKIDNLEKDIRTELETYWVDAPGCSCQFGVYDADPALTGLVTTATTGDDDDVSMRVNWQGGAGCSGSTLEMWDNSGGWSVVPNSASDLDCSGVACSEKSPVDLTWYTRNIDFEGAGSYQMRAYIFCGGQPFDGKFSSTWYVTVSDPVTTNYLCNTTYNGSGDWYINSDVHCNSTNYDYFGIEGNIIINGTYTLLLDQVNLNISLADYFIAGNDTSTIRGLVS